MRLALVVIAALAVLAAGAPFLAGDVPLWVTSAAAGAPTVAVVTQVLTRADAWWLGVAAFFVLGVVLPAVANRRGRTPVVAAAVLATAIVIGVTMVAEGPRAVSASVAVAQATGGAGATAARMPPVPFGPLGIDLAHRRAAPGAVDGHLLGTDGLGRDVLARIIHGLRGSLLLGFVAAVLALIAGLAVGVAAGCGGGLADALGSWVIATLLGIPGAFLVLALQAMGGVGVWTLALVLGFARVPLVARLVRADCRRVRALPFVRAVEGLGMGRLAVVARHVVPQALPTALVAAAFGVAGAIGAETGLSFLGFGVPDPEPSLGKMLADGRDAGGDAWHLVVVPGLVVTLLIGACHGCARALRDRLDPRGAEAAT